MKTATFPSLRVDAQLRSEAESVLREGETLTSLIETAVRLISQKGAGALSNAAVARALKINRTTVYYHFRSREALLRAVKVWSAEQLSVAFRRDAPQQERIDYITRFVGELVVGTVNVREVPGYRLELTPFGGIKDSGLGYKEGVQEAMKSFTNLKTYSLPW